MLLVCIALLIVFAVACHAMLERRRLLSLSWPEKLGHSRYARWVNGYLESQGWTIEKPGLSYTIHNVVAKRGHQRIYINSQSYLTEYTYSRIRDMCSDALTIGPKPLVCVTAKKVPKDLAAVAASSHILILHYKELKTFFEVGVLNQMVTFKELRLARAKSLEATGPAVRWENEEA